MQYADGRKIRVGDRVRMGNDNRGRVVCDIAAGKFTSLYPESEWAYLNEGVVIEFCQYGVIPITEVEADLELVARTD